jgi:hypothetical protein
MMLYLGRGLSPYPKRDPARLTAKFGDADGLDLVAYVERVLHELYEVKPDWDAEDLKAATDRAVRGVIDKHPELSTEAIDALRWSYSWDWK